MSPDPWLAITGGRPSIGSITEPVLIDPGERLLMDVVDAFRRTEPLLVDPDLESLHSANTRSDGSPGSPKSSRNPVPDHLAESVADVTPASLTVLAADDVIDAVTDGFHAASRLAALTESGVVELVRLRRPQPNVVLAGAETGCVLLESDTAVETRSRHCIGDDPSLRDRYADLVADASAHRLRTPSRHRVYGAFAGRCGVAVAADVIRLLDVDPSLAWEDPVDPRLRAYVVGARHGVLDRDLRRACEEAGLGSPSTFTRVKRRLLDADLVDVERVQQPIGRPRERIIAEMTLADPPITAVTEAVRSALEDG